MLAVLTHDKISGRAPELDCPDDAVLPLVVDDADVSHLAQDVSSPASLLLFEDAVRCFLRSCTAWGGAGSSMKPHKSGSGSLPACSSLARACNVKRQPS